MEILIKAILSGILNRCRGNNWFTYIPRTTITRLLAAIGLAIVNGFSQQWILIGLLAILFFNSMIYPWDIYWSAAAGFKPELKNAFKPVDWILSKLHIKPVSRLWGILGMGLRQTIGLFPVFLLMLYATGHLILIPLSFIPLLFGIPYLIFSYFSGTKFVMFSELVNGILISLLIGA